MIRPLPTLRALAALLAIAPAGAAVIPMAAFAQSSSEILEEDQPVLLSADEIVHDEQLGVVTARGSVEVSQGGRVLVADVVNYSPGTDTVSASGNVSLLEPTGEVLFANHMELDGGMKDGFIRDVRIILQDNARFAASGGRRSGGNFTELANAVYSPCEACKDDPDRPLLWQLRAKRVVHDQTRQTVEYKDATLDFLGVPVMYAPYFSHPDPTVKRRSGFLPPTIGSNSDTGVYVRVPYYWAISPSRDTTLAPMVTAEAGGGLAANYRERFDKGVLEADGSVLVTTTGDVESHIDAEARFDIDDFWRWGFDVERASSDEYLTRYGFDSPSVMTSNVFQEGFFQRSYARADVYAFQGLEDDDDPGTTPFVLPEVAYNYVGTPSEAGAFWTLDGNLRGLMRDEGAKSQRLSLKGGWTLPHVGRRGDITKITATVQGDLYAVQDQDRPGESSFDGITGRIHPQIAVDWRMPFQRIEESGVTQVIEPIIVAAIAPAGGNPDEIPNEDSQTVELDDINIFSHNRFGGIDRVEDGARISYGAQWSVHGAKGGSTHFLVGQSVRLLDNDTFSASSGLSGRLSDFVGRVQVEPVGPLSLVYRFRADKDDGSFVRNQINANGDWDRFGFNAGYFHTRQQTGSGSFPQREEISGGLYFNVSDEWRIRTSARRDLTSDGGMIDYRLAARYEDECFVFDMEFKRDFTDDLGSDTNDSIAFNLSFKTLGDVQSSVGRP